MQTPYLSSPHSSPETGVIQECSDCGLLSRLSYPIPGTNICCTRCGNVLREVRSNSLTLGLVWTITSLLFFLVTICSPMLEVRLYGAFRSGAIETGPLALDHQGYWILASVVLLTTILMPMIKIVGTLYVLISIRLKHINLRVATLYGFIKHLRPWVMIEVYLLGFIVAYSRLQVFTAVHLSTAVLGLVGLMLSMVAMDGTIDPEEVWDAIKKRCPVDLSKGGRDVIGCDTCYQVVTHSLSPTCPRCGDLIHNRKPNSLIRAWALMIAAAILYIPSNIFPVMNVIKLGKTYHYTIYGGLLELAHVGLWPLAVLVFVASIAIPVFKLVILALMLIQTQRRSSANLCARTQLYRVIDFIGRWSMVDIFVVSILVGLVRFGWLSQITPGEGGLYFTGVVILTLLAVKSFDPRIMWDICGKPILPPTQTHSELYQ